MKRFLQQQAKRLFLNSLREIHGGFLEIVCPDKTYSFGDQNATLRAMAVIHDERFFFRAVVAADIGIGESYMDGDWTTPDLVALVRLVVRNLRVIDSRHRAASAIRGFASRLRHRMRGNSISGSRENIRAHYDIGNEFYRLFLDEGMNYSSAYFSRVGESLEAAQAKKLDLICQKLRLQPGDRVLEIGCGWGGFAVHAAKKYGVHVKGVTISEEQFRYATDRVKAEQLGNGSVEIRLQDYRGMKGQFDKIVSIEMFEAVGLDRYDEFFSACDQLLTSEGAALLQTITLPDQQLAGYRKRVDWIQTYIFPGSELALLGEIQKSLARATKLESVHIESFGSHYAETLAVWRERFYQRLDRVAQLGFDERFVRMWDFYLGWCEGAFRERYINVAHILLAKTGTQQLLGDPQPAGTATLSASAGSR